MAGNTHDISAGTGAAAVIDGHSFIGASYKLGDAVDKLTAISMHSFTMAALAKQGLVKPCVMLMVWCFIKLYGSPCDCR